MQVPSGRVYFPEADRKRILEMVADVLASGQLALGEYTKQFEEGFAAYVGTQYAVVVNSVASALEVSLPSLDLKGASVILPVNSFFYAPAAVIHAGGRVIFVDITETLGLDPDSVRQKVEKDTRGIIAVHISGMVTPTLKEIQAICRERNLFLLEDASHAHGSTLDGRMAGTFGRAAVFAFYPTKVITTGEGGMIVTGDEGIYKKTLLFRDRNMAGFCGNIDTELGYNWRMSEIHAILGLSQLARIEEFIQARRKIAAIYDKGLKKMEGVRQLPIPANVMSTYYRYVAILDRGIDREIVKREMQSRFRVSLARPVYEPLCHLRPVFKGMYGFKGGEFPIAEGIYQRQICLPIFDTMTAEQAEYVLDSLRKVLGGL